MQTLEDIWQSLPNGYRWKLLSSSTLTAPADGTIEIRLIKPSSYSDVFYDKLTIKVQGELLAAEDIMVVQSDDYYPFGMAFNSITTSGDENLYKYNGKEEQKETELIDYGWRQYNAALGRWHAPDPLADQFMSLSPYNYVANNPIIFTDPDGRIITGDTDRVNDLKDAANRGIKAERSTQSRLSAKINKRSAKGKSTKRQERRMSNSKNRMTQYGETIAEIAIMEGSETEFHVVSSVSTGTGMTEGGTTFDSDNNRINNSVLNV